MQKEGSTTILISAAESAADRKLRGEEEVDGLRVGKLARLSWEVASLGKIAGGKDSIAPKTIS